MRKFLFTIFMFFIVFSFGSTTDVYANDDVNKVDIYLDGFPLPGKVIDTDSNVNVYDIPTYGATFVIDTVSPGSSLTILSLNVLNNSTNFYHVSYASDNTVKYGYISYDFVKPVGAFVTPAPGVDLEYHEPRLSEFFAAIRDFIYGVVDFFGSLYNCLFILFPFFTDSQVNFFITFASIFLGLGIYLLFRKVTI